MISKILLTAFVLLIKSITALNIVNVPTGTTWNPCSTYGVTLEGSGVGPGCNVRVELWDHRDGLDVETAVLANGLIVDENNTVFVTIPCDYPKTRNAFLRVYYKDANGVSGRIYIRKNEIASKTCPKPTLTPTHKPTHSHSHAHSHSYAPTFTPTCEPTIVPTQTAAPHPGSTIFAPSSQVTPGAVIYSGSHSDEASSASEATAAVRTTVSSMTRSKATGVTSTSSATTAKYSFGSIALALAITLSALLL